MFKMLSLKDRLEIAERENAKLKANVGEPKESQIEDSENKPKLFEQVETLDEIMDTIFGGK